METGLIIILTILFAVVLCIVIHDEWQMRKMNKDIKKSLDKENEKT